MAECPNIGLFFPLDEKQIFFFQLAAAPFNLLQKELILAHYIHGKSLTEKSLLGAGPSMVDPWWLTFSFSGYNCARHSGG